MFPTEKQFKLNPGLNTVVSKWNYLRFFFSSSSSFSSSFLNSFWKTHFLKIDRERLFRIWIVFEDTHTRGSREWKVIGKIVSFSFWEQGEGEISKIVAQREKNGWKEEWRKKKSIIFLRWWFLRFFF